MLVDLSGKLVHMAFLSAHTSLLVPAVDLCPSALQPSPGIMGKPHIYQISLHPHPSFPYKSTSLICYHPMSPPTLLSREDLGAPTHLSVGDVQVLGIGSISHNGGQAIQQVGFLVAQVQE